MNQNDFGMKRYATQWYGTKPFISVSFRSIPVHSDVIPVNLVYFSSFQYIVVPFQFILIHSNSLQYIPVLSNTGPLAW